MKEDGNARLGKIKTKLLKISRSWRIYKGNFELKKSTITLPFFKWQKGRKEKIAMAQPISTNSKSPSKGEENKTLPEIEKTLIIIIIINTQPPKIDKKFDK